jgi:hypothetical protein
MLSAARGIVALDALRRNKSLSSRPQAHPFSFPNRTGASAAPPE